MSNIQNKIESHSKFGIKLGLDNIAAVLEQLNNPQDTLQIIHIAGTNGKGSVSSMVSSCLQADGYTVAKYCSPYLLEFNEMFIINDQYITDEQLEFYYNQVIAASEQLSITLTLYEITTAIMFLYAASKEVDYLVLEVGLGGRLDATNVVIPKVSVITNISLDHTQILGDSIELIAAEKAGIIKPNVQLFTTESNPQAIAVFKSKTENLNIIDDNLEYKLNYDSFQTEVTLNQQVYNVNLFGSHQVKNFALSKAILDYLKIDDISIINGMKKVIHPGRLERISDDIIFDGAHNPASALALVESLKGYPGQIKIIVSVLKDKDVEQVIAILSQLTTDITFVPLPDLERGMSKDEIEQLQIPKLKICSKVELAIDRHQLNLVCGTFSLYQQVSDFK